MLICNSEDFVHEDSEMGPGVHFFKETGATSKAKQIRCTWLMKMV
jgi:hypothetical protein